MKRIVVLALVLVGMLGPLADFVHAEPNSDEIIEQVR